MIYELFVMAGNIQTGNRVLHLTEPSPFMAFGVGHFIDLPSGQKVPIREVHHQFFPAGPTNPTQQNAHRIVLLV